MKKHKGYLLIDLKKCILDISTRIFRIFITSDENDWEINYTHSTHNYDPAHYNVEPPSSPVSASVDTVTIGENNNQSGGSPVSHNISFGKTGKKYYIRGGMSYRIYRNSAGELRIINLEYDFDLDLEEQIILINKYANNPDIPEAMAISVINYIAENKWDDESCIVYFSVI